MHIFHRLVNLIKPIILRNDCVSNEFSVKQSICILNFVLSNNCVLRLQSEHGFIEVFLCRECKIWREGKGKKKRKKF